MSILSQALSGAISWTQAATQAEAWAAKWVASDPAAVALAGTALTEVKQVLSNAIGDAGTALAANKANIATGVATALETELAALTKGVSLPANPLITAGVDDLVNTAIAAAQAWGLEAKAALGPAAS